MDEKLVSIITVTRNRKELVRQCLDSVFKMAYPNFEMILVDNASADGTAEMVNKEFPSVKVISSAINLGLNGGKNKGEQFAAGDYVLFLDSDTIVDRFFLTELVRMAQGHPEAGIVCPKMFYYDHKDVIWYAGSYVNLLTSQTKNIGANQKDGPQWSKERETEFAPTAYLATKAVVDKLQGHNEVFFMTYGDTDYGFRAREAGFKVLFCPSAKLWHCLKKEDNLRTIRGLGYNLPMRAYYFARNRVIFMKMHAPRGKFILFLIFVYPVITIYMAYKIIVLKGGWKFLKPHLEGAFDGIVYLFTAVARNKYTS